MGEAAPAPRRRDTYADLEAVPAGKVAELLAGVRHVQPRPAPPHAATGATLVIAIGGPFQLGSNGGPGGWHIRYEPELHFSDPTEPGAIDVLIPDVAGWREERMPAHPKTAWFAPAPDWICEVLSPSTKRFDRNEKLPIYAREGVPHTWLIDPAQQSVEVHGLIDGAYRKLVTADGAARVRMPPFKVLELDLSLLWKG